jgi:hypothetical protein
MSARFSRGSSVLAALILVVLVGGVALAISTLATPGHGLSYSGSQVADVGATADAERSSDAFTSGAPANCQEAKQAALGRVFGPDSVNINNGQSGTMDACWGAYSTTGKPSNNPADYACVGRSGYAQFGDGIVTVKTSVNKLSEGGKCTIAICQDGKCAGAKRFDGINFSQTAASPSDPTTSLVQENGTGAAYPADLNNQDSAAINRAFYTTPEEAERALNDVQIAANNDRLQELKDYINNCDENCEDVDSAFQESSDLEAQNAVLQAQSDKLKADISNDLSAKSDALQPGDYQGEDPTSIDKVLGGAPSDCKSSGCVDLNSNNYGPTDTFGSKDSADVNKDTGLTDCKSEACASKNQNVYGGDKTGNGGYGGGSSGSEKTDTKSSGGLNGLMQSLFGGLMRALTGATGGAGGAGACTSDQNAYNQQLQQYQQQMTLYNQQLQQYNYQSYLAQQQGYLPPPQPTPPQQPCFTQSGSPVQCTTSPAQPDPAGCQGGTWRPTAQSGNSCITGWQCVPGNGSGAPTAQLSCQPQVADVGMSIAISFSCGNATGSAGQGFDTANRLSGSASTTIANPPAGATKATFGLQCINGSVPATASCSVDIARPSIILVANPKVVAENASSTIGWITTGMQSCTVSSPDLPEFTALNAMSTTTGGAAITPPLSQSATFLLHCTTLGGQTKDATTTVQVGAPGSDFGGGVSVSSNAEGHSINRGETMTIAWQSATSAPAAAEIDLWLYDTALEEPTALIKAYLNATGTYSWKLPLASDACDANSSAVCGTDLVPGREYAVEAVLYPDSDPDSQYIDYGFTDGTFIIGS